MTLTLEQWEAEKARIDELRAGVVHRAQELATTLFPYPPKPEKTVTLSTGAVVRYDKRIDRFAMGANTYYPWIGDANDVRALASLLPENQSPEET